MNGKSFTYDDGGQAASLNSRQILYVQETFVVLVRFSGVHRSLLVISWSKLSLAQKYSHILFYMPVNSFDKMTVYIVCESALNIVTAVLSLSSQRMIMQRRMDTP